MADRIIKLVEDFVSLRGVVKNLNAKLSKELSEEVLLESARVSKQLWGVQYHMSQQPMDALNKVLVDKKVELEKIFAQSGKSGKRLSRNTKAKTNGKTKTKTQSKALSTILS